eukprot:2534386-Pleurochrysis_carterae.AAC.5
MTKLRCKTICLEESTVQTRLDLCAERPSPAAPSARCTPADPCCPGARPCPPVPAHHICA